MNIIGSYVHTDTLLFKSRVEDIFSVSFAIHPTYDSGFSYTFVGIAKYGLFRYVDVFTAGIVARIAVDLIAVNMVVSFSVFMFKISFFGHIFAVGSCHFCEFHIPLK